MKAIIVCFAAMLASATVMAGTPHIDAREAAQSARISQGVGSGELTKFETARLVKGQVELRHMEAHAKADGIVTVRERARLQRKAYKESAKIYYQKHDGQNR